ncbi:MAG TPA: PQQ-binding-like beta-propeller repeat protein, partial [Polyangiaceae bacterium]
TQRASGTEILTVHVTDNGRLVWEKELTYASCTFGAAIAVAPGKIMLWAAQPSERNKGLLVGLDEATGSQLYELPITDTSSDSPELFRYNGKYVVAVNWGALRAYEPATGAEAWRVGR